MKKITNEKLTVDLVVCKIKRDWNRDVNGEKIIQDFLKQIQEEIMELRDYDFELNGSGVEKDDINQVFQKYLN